MVSLEDIKNEKNYYISKFGILYVQGLQDKDWSLDLFRNVISSSVQNKLKSLIDQYTVQEISKNIEEHGK